MDRTKGKSYCNLMCADDNRRIRKSTYKRQTTKRKIEETMACRNRTNKTKSMETSMELYCSWVKRLSFPEETNILHAHKHNLDNGNGVTYS